MAKPAMRVKAEVQMSNHNYLTKLTDTNINPNYRNTVRKIATPLIQKKLPVILSLKHLAILSGVSYNTLNDIIYRNGDFYRVFPIKKRNGDKRWITVPNGYLMKVQKWINENILNNQSTQALVSLNSTAYKKDSSHILNASMHLGQSELIKLDITRFFESISERQVFRVFKDIGYKNSISFFLTRICTRLLPLRKDKRTINKEKRWFSKYYYKCDSTNKLIKRIGHLPQGAPTSPILANLVCKSLDSEIDNLVSELNLSFYTRYADDIVISGKFKNTENAISCIQSVSKILRKNGFKVNHIKTRYCNSGARKIITGLCVNDLELKVPKDYKKKIRQELYYIKKYGVLDHCNKLNINNPLNYVLRLEGKINYLKNIEPINGLKEFKKLNIAIPNLQEIKNIK